MRPQRNLRRDTCRLVLVFIVALFCTAPTTAAQEAQPPPDATASPSFAGSVVKGVLLDPTTFAPAFLGYFATMGDWNSSQVLFRRGYIEGNARFTVSGLPNDMPVSYEEGTHRILGDAAANLGRSVVNNMSSRVVEQLLVRRFPNHRRAVRTIGWIQRAALGAYTGYLWSGPHYRQWSANLQLARQAGH